MAYDNQYIDPNDALEQKFNSAFEHFEPQPDKQVWEKVQNGLNKEEEAVIWKEKFNDFAPTPPKEVWANISKINAKRKTTQNLKRHVAVAASIILICSLALLNNYYSFLSDKDAYIGRNLESVSKTKSEQVRDVKDSFNDGSIINNPPVTHSNNTGGFGQNSNALPPAKLTVLDSTQTSTIQQKRYTLRIRKPDSLPGVVEELLALKWPNFKGCPTGNSYQSQKVQMAAFTSSGSYLSNTNAGYSKSAGQEADMTTFATQSREINNNPAIEVGNAFSYGITLDIPIKKRINIKTGILYSNTSVFVRNPNLINSNANWQEQNTSNSNYDIPDTIETAPQVVPEKNYVEPFNHSLQRISVPINLKYYFSKKLDSKFTFFAETGVTPHFFVTATPQNHEIDNQSIYKDISLSTTASLGLTYRFSKYFSLEVSPAVTYDVISPIKKDLLAYTNSKVRMDFRSSFRYHF